MRPTQIKPPSPYCGPKTYNDDSIGVGDYAAGVTGAFWDGLVDSFWSGEAGDSAVRVINIGPVLGHDDAYGGGQGIGKIATKAMDVVSIVNGIRKPTKD